MWLGRKEMTDENMNTFLRAANKIAWRLLLGVFNCNQFDIKALQTMAIALFLLLSKRVVIHSGGAVKALKRLLLMSDMCD